MCSRFLECLSTNHRLEIEIEIEVEDDEDDHA